MKSVKISVNKLELQAAVETAAMVVGSAVLSLMILFIFETVPMRVIGGVFGIGVFAFLVYVLWKIRLDQLQYVDKLHELRRNMQDKV